MGSDLPEVSQLPLAEQRPEPLSAALSSVQASGTHSLAALQRFILPKPFTSAARRLLSLLHCRGVGGGAEEGLEMPLGWVHQGEAQYSEGLQV